MVGYLLAICAILLLIYMSLAFLAGWSERRLSMADTAWGGGFVIVALACWAASFTPSSNLLAVLVLIWGFRLIFHIGTRSHVEDPRYKKLSSKWGNKHFWLRGYFSVFLTQGLLIWIIALPLMLAPGTSHSLHFWQWIAVAIWALAFIFEAVSDHQLRQFINSKTKSEKVMNKGLWRYSRHPNYFGELIQWFMIAVIAAAAPYGYIAFVSPLLLTYLIIFVSGLPPQENRHKDDPAYLSYRKKTSVLIPLPPR